MKTYIRLILLLWFAILFPILISAQTAVPDTINWQFNKGIAGQLGTYTAGTSDFFSLNWVVLGSNLKYLGKSINFGDTLTTLQPLVTSAAGDSSSDNLLSFNFRLNAGLFFKPTSISFDCGRFGTDGGLVKMAWKTPDGTITYLQSNVRPNRINASSTPPIYPTHLTYDLSSLNIPDTEGDYAFYFYIYSLTNTKNIGIGNVTISGQMTGNTALKDPTTIAWENPQPVAHGTALSDVQLNAVVTGSTGAVTYTPAIGAVLNAGYQTLTVKVAADDTYAAATRSIILQVYPDSSVLSWNPPTGITYGTPLSAGLFGANVTGTTSQPTYVPALDTILPAGTYPVSVLFNADDNHCAAGAITSVTINKAASTITWNTPADITSGTALNTTQLNAVVSGTTGAPTYSPSLGTVLLPGTHTLTVIFGEDANYEGVSGSVTINVTGTVSVETLTDVNVNIFPNPFGQKVTVTIPKLREHSVLTITNSNGTVILSQILTSETTTINLKNFPAGTYLFRISTGNGNIVKQIVKE